MSWFAFWPSDMYPTDDLKHFIFAVSILRYYVQFSHLHRSADKISISDHLKKLSFHKCFKHESNFYTHVHLRIRKPF